MIVDRIMKMYVKLPHEFWLLSAKEKNMKNHSFYINNLFLKFEVM